ncbi:MAG TPA: hypothetical protein VIF10_08670 [Methylobacter sp.]
MKKMLFVALLGMLSSNVWASEHRGGRGAIEHERGSMRLGGGLRQGGMQEERREMRRGGGLQQGGGMHPRARRQR